MNNKGLDQKREHNINNPNKPPEILYKYARWDKEYHKKLITTPEIYFASPGDFNDPYDCLVIPRYDKWSVDDWKKMYRQMLQSKYPVLTDHEIEAKANQLIRDYHANPQCKVNEINRINRGQELHFNNNIGVFCLSEIKESIIMWSHYTNSHKGFCVGYDISQIKSCVENYYRAVTPKIIRCFNVDYEPEYPEVIPVPELRDPEAYFKRLKTKFAGWEYEKEWRLVVNQNKPLYERIVNIPIEAIAEINLGFRMSQANISNIIFELKSLNYKGKLYKAKQEDYRYQLAFNEIVF